MKDGFAENRLFVITGGPGSGKTTLIEVLASRGLKSSIESGRAIIKDQLMIGGNALPWSNPLAFAELMLSLDLDSYALARNTPDSVVFDRGIPDVIGYLNLMKLPV